MRIIIGIAQLLAGVLNLYLAYLVWRKDPRKKANLYLALTALFSSEFVLSFGLSFITLDPFWTKATWWGFLILPSVVVFLLYFSNASAKTIKIAHVVLWPSAIFFCCLAYTPLIIKEVISIYPNKVAVGPWEPIARFYFALYSPVLYYLLIKQYLVSQGVKRLQIKYFLLGITIYSVVALVFSMIMPILGRQEFLPFTPLFSLLWIGLTIYAIVKHHLMDIRLAVTKAGIFFAVYALTLGFPFCVGYYTKSWFITGAIMAALALIGPAIHRHLQKKAEAALLQNQVRQQEALLAFAGKVSSIRDTQALFKETLTKTFEIMQPEFARLYTYSVDKEAYILQDSLDVKECSIHTEFASIDPLINALNQDRKPVFLETVEKMPAEFHEAIVLPFHENVKRKGLASFLILGPKKDNTLYDQQDMNSFEILSIQVSLSLENCCFWEDEKTRIAREEQIKRVQAMDHFSGSFIHEVGNPVFAVKTQLEALCNVLNFDVGTRYTPQEVVERIKSGLDLAFHDSERVVKMVKVLKEYTAQNTGELSLVKFDDVLETVSFIIRAPIGRAKIKYEQIVDSGITLIGNKVQLAEILVNLGVNAIYAVTNCKPPLEPGKAQISLRTHVAENTDANIVEPVPALNELAKPVSRGKPSRKKMHIEFSDNGCGIRKDMLEDIFLDFVTTKASSVSSGLGLGIVRKIVQRHGGKVWAYSQGQNTGATFFVELPIPGDDEVEACRKVEAERKNDKHKL